MKTPAFVLAAIVISGALSIAHAQTDTTASVQPALASIAPKVVTPGTVLTNADLKPVPPPPPFVRPVVRPEAIYEHYLERQRASEARRGPVIGVIGSPTAGPFGEFKPFDPPRRLDGTLLSDPPWGVTTFIPWTWPAPGFWSGPLPAPSPPPPRSPTGR